ncbi:serine/threonine-protein kinase [Serinibacter salmoneus]|uniref:non-specific serine/threonine protein kinase n=1 Tax=Serinibacter salmoneus TaxID=556530 RepID=A0A2A9D320_9MICO|nr:serine/threonine-protein kinase [Serinibacter salmoneus]PFG20781.1 serine/threonine protein kinase [Serinibacter salmoneus]
MRRPGAPAIEGLEPLDLIGRGGSADVYTYRQVMPPRTVAVKVLHGTGEGHTLAPTEAVVMAALSHHPAIVTIHQAGVSEDGRRYLVMEYCSRPNLARRYRSEPMGVPEALSLGVRLSAAVETAHRSGVLHRDIKPANVLVTDYGWPALADFGIASSHGGSTGGMSLLWAAPEAVEDPDAFDARSDVYSLAATIYTLLAGHAPHERGSERLEASTLVDRTLRESVPPLGRSDVPTSLEAVLARAMARDPQDRFDAAVDLGHALQDIERELGLPVTELTLSLPETTTGDPSLVDLTDWDTAATGATTRRLAAPAPAVPGGERGRSTPRSLGGVGGVGEPGSPAPATAGSTVPAAGRVAVRRLALALCAAIVATIIIAWALSRAAQVETPDEPTPAPEPAFTAGVPAPSDLVLRREGEDVVATWVNPSPQPGDRFSWQAELDGVPTARESTTRTQVRVPAGGVTEVCLQVAVVRQDGALSDPEEQCVP